MATRFSTFQKPFLVMLSWLIVVVANTIVLSHALTQPCSSSSLQAHGIKVISSELVCDNATLTLASNDYGHTSHERPLAVLEPTSPRDISKLIKLSNSLSTPFTIAARGQAHSIHGQAMARDGIVVNMTNLKVNGYRHRKGIVIVRNEKDAWKSYADVGGEQTWVDLLHAALEYGLTPVTWTDSLDLSIGGTLSNAGTGGEAFRFGPQMTNVYQLDVITGKGDYVTCSETKNSKLFYAVLGGLGQFGIITRARIALAPSKPRAKWLRMIYTDFPAFIKDKKHLSSFNGRRDDKAPDYVEGLNYYFFSLFCSVFHLFRLLFVVIFRPRTHISTLHVDPRILPPTAPPYAAGCAVTRHRTLSDSVWCLHFARFILRCWICGSDQRLQSATRFPPPTRARTARFTALDSTHKRPDSARVDYALTTALTWIPTANRVLPRVIQAADVSDTRGS
ncbi:Cytokinin dehydrogenase [Stylosanthes scabra]|uniref:Cytokinin dehydrogenase n=1 Tax=Stylosanthes scabra TaxID=79078 RepID=A0ABU6QC60_9FABA|nr:Cytokinin dehydrogenase [Stylosanthes scabra]